MKTNKGLIKFDIENKASTFRKNNGFGETDPIRLESLLLKKNIITLFKPLSGSLAGMAIKVSDEAMFILVNCNHSLGKQHFTIAHELYHLFVQENFNSQKCLTGLFEGHEDIEEQKADLFAANLLLPELGVFELIPEKERQHKNAISAQTIFRIQQYYSVSIKAVIYRLVEFGLVDKSYFDTYASGNKIMAKKLGYDIKLYEKGNFEKSIGDYATLASSLYSSQKISESYYLELLNAIGFDPFAADEQEDEF